MSFLSDYITKKNKNGEKVLSVFLTAGYPNKNNFLELVNGVYNAGADLIELGFPFSDPLADGKVIQQSSQNAIENGITLKDVFVFAKEIKKINNKPLVLMGYANPIIKFGIKYFADEIRISGIDGVIIPDVPIEEYDEFYGNNFNGIDTILLITPTTTNERIKLIDNQSSGFVYCVSISGTTGSTLNIEVNTLSFLRRARENLINNKMLVGFGISNSEDSKKLSQYCDGIIVGSAIIKAIEKNDNYKSVFSLVKELKESLL